MRFVFYKLIFISILLSSLFSSRVIADAYSDGYNKYLQGDFSGAESAFKSALGPSLSDFEKGRIYKMLGISQYMQGKRAEAEGSFKNAKKVQPHITISASEVLDQTVLDFFNSVETPKSQVQKAEPKASTPAPEKYVEQEKKARLIVSSNISSAKVLLDNTQSITLNQEIELSPGTHTIEVSSYPDYATVKQDINLDANKLTKMNFTLRKKTSSEEKKPSIIPTPTPEPNISDADSKNKKDVKKKKRPTHVNKISKDPKYSGVPKSNEADLLYILPMGIPQFSQGKHLLGSLLGLGQFVGIAGYVYLNGQADKKATETNEVIAQRTEEMDRLPESEQEAYYQETLSIFNEKNSSIDAQRTQGNYGLMLFFGLWAISTIDAFNDTGTSSSSSSLPSKREPLISLQSDSKHLFVHLWDRDFYSSKNLSSPMQLDWSISPFLGKIDHSDDGMALSLHLKF